MTQWKFPSAAKPESGLLRSATRPGGTSLPRWGSSPGNQTEKGACSGEGEKQDRSSSHCLMPAQGDSWRSCKTKPSTELSAPLVKGSGQLQAERATQKSAAIPLIRELPGACGPRSPSPLPLRGVVVLFHRVRSTHQKSPMTHRGSCEKPCL